MNVKVTNDIAERGIHLVQSFVNTLTKNDEDLQWLLQEVEQHRKKLKDFTKSTLSTQ